MNKVAILAIFAVVALQSTLISAKAVVPAEKSIIETLSEDAQNVIKSFADATGLTNLTSEKVIQTIETDAKKIAANIDGFVEKVKKDLDAKKPEINKVIKNVQTELLKTSESLKKLVGPENAKKVEEIKKGFEKNLAAVIEPINKVIKAVTPDAEKLKTDLEASGKAVLDSVIDGAKKVAEAVKENVNKVGNKQ